MRRPILMISALAGALSAAPAFAQSDDLVGDDGYSTDDYAPAPAEEYVGDDTGATDDYAATDDYLSDDVQPAYDDSGDLTAYDDESYSDPALVDNFRSTLAPYGQWIRTPEYGQVWVPSRSVVGSNFTPYATGGSWRYSNAGWMFASSYSWGWAPFHYGRWYRAARWGWVWVPGSVWAPAWVDWRYGSGYVGWAPLPPRRYLAALRHHNYWFFCSLRNMRRPWVARYRVHSTPHLFRSARFARRPVRHGRARWFAGPNPRAIERVTRSRVDRVQVRPPRSGHIGRVHANRDNRPRIDRRQQVQREQRVERRPQVQRPQRVERQQQVREQRQQQVREQRQQQVREQRQHQMREQRQQQVREQRQHQMREQREQRQQRQQQVRQQREQRQHQPREQRVQQRQHQPREQRVQQRQQAREQRVQQRQQAREQRVQQRQPDRERREQPARERRRRPDR